MNTNTFDLKQKAIEEEIAFCLEDLKNYEKQLQAKDRGDSHGTLKEQYDKAKNQLTVAQEELKALKQESELWEISHPIVQKKKKQQLSR